MKTIYDEKTINNEYEKLLNEVRKGGKIDPLNRSLGATLGHTIDALEFTKDNNNQLDLFELSEDKISKSIIAMYMYFRSSGDSVAVCKEKVIKKIGGYLFFAVCNLCNRKNDIEAYPIAKGTSLYLEIKEDNGGTSQIDVLYTFEKFINKNLKYERDSGTMIIIDPEKIIGFIKEQINFDIGY